ncbi:MAG: hypothetical protein ACRD18_08205 [Terriglobia bacterium]
MGTPNRKARVIITVAGALFLACARPVPLLGQSTKQPSHTSGSASPEGWGRSQTVGCLYVLESPLGVPNRVVVKENPAAPRRPLFEVYFIGGWPDSPRTLLVRPEGYTFVDMFLVPGRILVTEWAAGDRPVVQAFRLVKGGAEVVFNQGARAGFEFWNNTILQSNAAIGPDGNYHTTTTQIWEWKGQQYQSVGTVPYAERLGALTRLSHEAENK